MPRLTKKQKQEWAFFIHPDTKRRTYNKLCRSCIHNCKQSYRVTVVECRRYASKIADYYARKTAPKRCKKDDDEKLRERYYPP